jgi:hypothetical protein
MIFSETITGNSTLIVSHIVVDTGLPCADIVTNPDACDCNAFVDAYESGGSYSREFKLDDIIIHPRMPNFEYQAKRFGVPQERDGSPRESRQDYDKIVAELAATNNRFNCEIYKKGGVASANNVMMTELFHDQPQLFGFPIISNPLTDPIPLYTHTTMRMIGAARSAGTSAGSLTRGIDTLGPVCFAYPMVVDSATTHLAEVNLIENGWLKWNPGNSDPNYVTMSLQFPQMSLGEFVDAGGGPNVLRIGSSVAKTPAVAGTNPELTQLLTSLVGNQFLVPTSASPGSSPVTVDGFVWVSIPVESGINLATGTVNAVVDKQTAPPETCATTGLPE